MNIFVVIYSIVAIVWTVFTTYSMMTGNFLFKEEREILQGMKESMGRKKYTAFLLISAAFELLLWPLSVIYYLIIMPIGKWYYKVPQD